MNQKSIILFDLAALVSGDWGKQPILPENCVERVRAALAIENFENVGVFSYQIWSRRDHAYYDETVAHLVPKILDRDVLPDNFLTKYDIMQMVRTKTTLFNMNLSDFDDFYKRPSDAFPRLFIRGAYTNTNMVVVGNEKFTLDLAIPEHNSRLRMVPL